MAEKYLSAGNLNLITSYGYTGENMRLAYLAPEIPARSATFVYQEIKELERLGYIVDTYSIREPYDLAPDCEDLKVKTTYLYHPCLLLFPFFLLYFLVVKPSSLIKSIRWLISDIRNVPGLKSRSKLVFQYCAASYLSICLKRNRVTHLHVHFAHVPTQVAMYASALVGIPFTVTSHANDIFERGLLLKQKEQRSKKFFTISNHNKEFLVDMGLDPNRVSVVRCGVSLNYNDVRPRIQGPESDIVIGSLGRLVEKKGMDILLKAISELRKAPGADKFKIRIAGDGPLNDYLKELSSELEIDDITIFDGALNHNQVSEWLGQIDLFVLACQMDENGDQDGIPVVLMEAMSQSVPVISTKISGIPELITDGKTGFLAEPGSVVSLERAVLKAISAKNELDSLTKHAIGVVKSEFALTGNVNRLLQVFQSSNKH